MPQVVAIEDNAFSYGGLYRVVLPDALASLGQYCFYDCHEMESMKPPDALTAFDETVFEKCGYLTLHVADGSPAMLRCEEIGRRYEAESLYPV